MQDGWFLGPPLQFEQQEEERHDEEDSDQNKFSFFWIDDHLKVVDFGLDKNSLSDLKYILRYAWIDKDYQYIRKMNRSPCNMLRMEEFSLLHEVSKIFKGGIIPTPVANIILTILGRDKLPNFDTNDIPWPEDAERFTETVEYDDDCGPIHIFPTLLLRTAIDTIPLPQIAWKVDQDPNDPNAVYSEQGDLEKYLIKDRDVFKYLGFGKSVEFPLSFYTTLQKWNGRIDRYAAGEHYWFSLSTDDFQMSYGDDISNGINSAKIPWINTINDKYPPTISKNGIPQVEWINHMEDDQFIDTPTADQCCPISNPEGYRQAFEEHFRKANENPLFTLQYLKSDGSRVDINSKPYQGQQIDDNNIENHRIICIWCDPETGRIPKQAIQLDNTNKNLLLIECNEKCPCRRKCKCCPLVSAVPPSMSMVYFENKNWGIVANEDIEEGQFIAEYTGRRIENISGPGGPYLYDLSIGYITNNPQIDAQKASNISRFYNHSDSFGEKTPFPEPNVIVFKIISSLINTLKIGYFAKRKIYKGEEITLNYGGEYPWGGECQCVCNFHLKEKFEKEQNIQHPNSSDIIN